MFSGHLDKQSPFHFLLLMNCCCYLRKHRRQIILISLQHRSVTFLLTLDISQLKPEWKPPSLSEDCVICSSLFPEEFLFYRLNVRIRVDDDPDHHCCQLFCPFTESEEVKTIHPDTDCLIFQHACIHHFHEQSSAFQRCCNLYSPQCRPFVTLQRQLQICKIT